MLHDVIRWPNRNGPSHEYASEVADIEKDRQTIRKVLLVFSGSTSDVERIVAGARPSLWSGPNQPVRQMGEVVRA
jgi:hypothetical protein